MLAHKSSTVRLADHNVFYLEDFAEFICLIRYTDSEITSRICKGKGLLSYLNFFEEER